MAPELTTSVIRPASNVDHCPAQFWYHMTIAGLRPKRAVMLASGCGHDAPGYQAPRAIGEGGTGGVTAGEAVGSGGADGLGAGVAERGAADADGGAEATIVGPVLPTGEGLAVSEGAAVTNGVELGGPDGSAFGWFD